MKVTKESTADMLRVFSVSPKHNFILTLAMGITFGFSFACILLNVTYWESSSRTPAPSSVRLIKISRSVADYSLDDFYEKSASPDVGRSSRVSLSSNPTIESQSKKTEMDPFRNHQNHRPLTILKQQASHEIELHNHEGKSIKKQTNKQKEDDDDEIAFCS